MRMYLRKNVIAFFIIFNIFFMEALFSCRSEAIERTYKNSIGMEFVLVPAGTFIMGSPPDEPYRNQNERQHQVTITKPFYMQGTEVTVEQWTNVMGKKLFGRRYGMATQPVVRVSWFECLQLIEKLNGLKEGRYRLPTEAEWEYACRAGGREAYSWGGKIECSQAAFGLNSLKTEECIKYAATKGLKQDGPVPVKSYPPNAWGLYDMHGNIWEWCQDWSGEYPGTSVIDPGGPASGDLKIRRGGSWFREGWLCRSANRNSSHPAAKYDTLGFRLVREVE